jgi:hypothetical protein
VPSRENNAVFWLIGSSWPAHDAQPRGANVKPKHRISPMNGSGTVSSGNVVAGPRTAGQARSSPVPYFRAPSSPAPPTLGSSDSVAQAVTLRAIAGGPYTVGEGGKLVLDGSGSSPGVTYAWDLNGDGDFTDATGASPTVSWEHLEALGIDDGPSRHPVTLRISLGAFSARGAATLSVTNAPPAATASSSPTATWGTPFALRLGADDPSPADQAGTFHYTVNWGDGSGVEVVEGAALTTASHTYTQVGRFTVTVTATDKDGGTGVPVTTAVEVSAAPAPPAYAPSAPALAATGSDAGLWALVGALLAVGGALLVLVARRPRREVG